MLTVETIQFTVGSSDGADFQIDQEGVSRVHLKIIYSDDSVLLEDLNSSYGTFVYHSGRFKRIKTAKVTYDTKIRIGSEQVELLVGDLVKRFEEKRYRDKKDLSKKVQNISYKRCLECGAVLEQTSLYCDCCGHVIN